MVLLLFMLAVGVGVAAGAVFESILLGMAFGAGIAFLALYASYKRLTAEDASPPPPPPDL
jgi:hypothetical protein